MNRTIGVFKMHYRDKFSWLLLPWFICSISFFVNLIVGASINEENGFYTGGIASIFIYMLIIGLLVLPQTFSFTLGMGVRRTDYFLGTFAAFIVTGAVMTVLLLLLGIAENDWLSGWGVGLHFFHLPFVNEGPVPLQALALFSLLLTMFFIGFAIGCLYRKFGRLGLYALFTLLVLIFAFTPLLISYYDRWEDIGRWLRENIHSLNDLAPWLLMLTALLVLGSFGLLRRSTV